ncbi:MAG: hypothetical protein DRO14_00315 [Thermoprotei archaeon]|mgnify:CR=1 FL=1|nr:MAG: hypothetical protein DRO14_00120 [Thermoprotei archaeon]RLG78592.1 MAG: hypothetical protein DRO14_00315 [Thermoprotei archaeon]
MLNDDIVRIIKKFNSKGIKPTAEDIHNALRVEGKKYLLTTVIQELKMMRMYGYVDREVKGGTARWFVRKK